MKKSEIYRQAQISVLHDGRFTAQDKLDILRELMDKEDVALFTEKREEKDRGDQS